MKNNKYIKILLIFIVVLIVVVIIINNIIMFQKRKMFLEYLNKASSLISEKLNNKTMVGDASFKLKVDTDISDKIIIPSTEYKSSYQVDIENKYVNIDLSGNHTEGNLNSNAYISDGKFYFLLKDTYDKYITYDIGNLDIFTNSSNYNNVIVTLVDVLSENLNNKYFEFNKTKLNGYKVDEITLDLSGKNYRSILNKTKKILRHNDEFVNSAYKLFGYYGEDFEEFLSIIDIDSYKFSLYVASDTKEFIGFKVDSDEIDINFSYKKDKYIFEYYLRDGLINDGYIKLNNNKIESFEFSDLLEHWKVNIKFSEFNIKYNEKVDSYKNIEDIINYSDVGKNEIEIITSNEVVEEIYDNYVNRYMDEYGTDGEDYIDPGELLPEDYGDTSDGSIGY